MTDEAIREIDTDELIAQSRRLRQTLGEMIRELEGYVNQLDAYIETSGSKNDRTPHRAG